MQNIKRLVTLVAFVFLLGSEHALAQSAQVKYFPYQDSIARTCLTFDGLGNLWGANYYNEWTARTTPGIAKFDGTTWQAVSIEGLANDTIASMTRDRQGQVWCAGNKCVAFYNAGTNRWTSIPVQDSLSSVRDYVSIVCDSQGNIWAASIPKVVWQWRLGGTVPDYYNTGQVHKWNGQTWTTYDL